MIIQIKQSTTLKIQSEFESLYKDLDSIEALYRSSNYIDSSEFKEFVSYSFNDKEYLESIYFLPHITQDNFKEAKILFEKDIVFDTKNVFDQRFLLAICPKFVLFFQ